MNKKYVELFSLIAQSTANLAEQVMNIHTDDEEAKERKTAQIMRDDFQALHNKLEAAEDLTKVDFARLLVGAIIIVNQLEKKIQSEEKALQSYRIDIIPKLYQINNAESEEEALKLAAEIFEINEEESHN